MAKVTFESSISGVRGKVDRWVFREQYGKTVIMPLSSRKDRPSAAQIDHRGRFKDAQAYAAAVLADPLKRECYRKLGLARGCPPNALLVSNFLNPPTIDQVDFSAYRGRAGDAVRVLATDRIEVIGVTLLVRGADGVAIETGPALKDHDLWVYRCTVARPEHGPISVEVIAQNRAGAKGGQTVPLT